MCGIAGIISAPRRDLGDIADRMTDAMKHRGPDDRGTITFPEDGVALGMRRLSIIDLAGGHQPMHDEAGRHHLVFNGEIYNFAELRRELVARGHVFTTDHSDTEVIVHGFEEWGHGLFPRLNGMFAIAIWDTQQRQLTVARDRMGKKPLYLARIPGGWAFGSELKAVLEHPDVSREVDLVAREQYLAFDYVLGPRTMLASVQKVPAGSSGTLTPDSLDHVPYWSPSIDPNLRSMGAEDLLERLDEALDAAVARRMVADVPVGLFLSGGLDSTTVGYFMRRHSDDVHSFSIGFEEHDFDESSHAKAAARSLGTTHHLEVMSQQRLLEIVPRIPEVLDEPMGDQSILPTYLLSEFTRRDVTVALGGDGSDELLMGYNSFRPLKAAWKLDWVPRPVRSAAAAAAKRSPNVVAGRHLRGVEFARRIEKTPLERLLSHLGSFKGDARGVLSGEARSALPPSVYSGVESSLVNGASGGLGPADQTVFAYARGYLQEDILVKVDRASMASSLEVRTPFLDPNVVELAISAPPALRHRGLTGKYLLRRLMRGRIPSELIDRPKVGFGVPINAWLRGPLAPMLREHLSRDRIESGGYFHPSTVERLLDEHLSGTANRGNELWLLLQFEAWRDRWLS